MKSDPTILVQSFHSLPPIRSIVTGSQPPTWPNWRGAWNVDTRSLIFAHEDDPLDLYRTILRIEEERKPAFKQFGGSMLVLSPLGSRMLSIGSLMAALDRDLPVYYVEARGYEVDWNAAGKILPAEPTIRHVWLAGEVYPSM